jgi:hypothetical protein
MNFVYGLRVFLQYFDFVQDKKKIFSHLIDI